MEIAQEGVGVAQEGVGVTTRSPSTVITLPSDVAEVRDHWVEAKRQELLKAEEARAALKRLKVNGSRLTRANDRVRLLKGVVRALEAGYIPIPRFDSERLDIDVQELPIKALVALSNAQKLFDEVRFVQGLGSASRGDWRLRGRRPQRDPLIVGVIRTPEHRVPVPHWPGHFMRAPGLEEHFLIAWWRPEDERNEELF